VHITPAIGTTGTYTITLNIDDTVTQILDSFTLTVTSGNSAPYFFPALSP
jgi:hypothetical protein